MLKPAFSTVACPDWTLRHVAQEALEHGFEAVELRTFGDDSRRFACDPALSDEAKTRTMFLERGVEVLSVATGVRFDEPVWPPVLGMLGSHRERSVREGKRAVDLAVGLECPLVRVFGFEYPNREKRPAALARIAERLRMVCDHADKSGVRIVVENGGSFATAAELADLIRAVNHPLAGACYCNATAAAVGEDPSAGIGLLGDRLWLARVKDVKDGRPCLLGDGEMKCEAFVRTLAATGFNGPLVFEWDRAWVPDLAGPDQVLKHAARTIYTWLGAKPETAIGPAEGGKKSPMAGARR
jgi:sugar phosphate isomerase/epimerase